MLRPPQRRQGTSSNPIPVSRTPSKAPLTIEEWETLAPLSDTALRSVANVKAVSEKTPLPPKFVASESNGELSALSRPGTPLARNRLLGGPSSRPGTPLARLHQAQQQQNSNAATLHPKHPVLTPQQFYDWMALIDRSVAHSQESHFRAHVADVAEHLEACDRLVGVIDEVEREVDGMMQGWIGVEESGKSLKDACERLLDERDMLLGLTDEIEDRLQYFQELEKATRMLNHPGESLVLQSDFLYMVERVDISIEYLRAHRHFREAEIYLLRFQQCLTRAMTLIKMFFVGSLRALSADINKRMSDNEISNTAQTHLLYTRFRTVSTQLSPLLGELERRTQAHPEELSALLAECHVAYFTTRKALLVGRLTEEIRGLDPGRTELVELTRSGCSYLKQLCMDEFELYREFFNSGKEQLYAYLENLCDYLYDDLRPRILHEPRLTALCEVCTVLQALMVLDVPSLPGDDESESDASVSESSEEEESGDEEDASSSDRDDSTTTRGASGGRSLGALGRLHISHLLEMVLQDAQTRLFFKAQSVIQSNIRYYVPKAEDLAYPGKLVEANSVKISSGNEIREKESIGSGQMLLFKRSSSSLMDKQDTWYPTLRKTVWVLTQLHDFVKPAIFDDIAQEAISLCRLSLVSAADMIMSRPSQGQTPAQGGPAGVTPPQAQLTKLDGHLFLVRHLLILKEIAFNLEEGMTGDVNSDAGLGAAEGANAKRFGPDFSGTNIGSTSGVTSPTGGSVADTLSLVLNKTSSLLPGGLFASLGPKRDESIREVKHGIVHDLRRACEDVIGCIADPICIVIDTTGTAAATNLASTTASSTAKAPTSASLTPESIQSMNGSFLGSLAPEQPYPLRTSIERVWMYLEDEKTVNVILGHVRDRIEGVYDTFRYRALTMGIRVLGEMELRERLSEVFEAA